MGIGFLVVMMIMFPLIWESSSSQTYYDRSSEAQRLIADIESTYHEYVGRLQGYPVFSDEGKKEIERMMDEARKWKEEMLRRIQGRKGYTYSPSRFL